MTDTSTENMFDNLDVAKKYLDITEKYGPSEQLLAFIDNDGALESEIGIEGFNGFSLETRHEIVKTKLQKITNQNNNFE